MLNRVKGVRAVMLFVAVLLVLQAGVALAAESVEYHPVVTVYPDTEVATWTKYTSDPHSVSIVDGKLLLDSRQSAGGLFYSREIDSAYATDTVTIEAKVKLVEYSGTYDGGCGIWFADDVTSQVMTIFPDRIELYYPWNSGESYSMDTTDDYHTYKLVFNGAAASLKIFVDGGETPVIDTLFDTDEGYDRDWIMFGDGSGNSGSKASWEYVKYQID